MRRSPATIALLVSLFASAPVVQTVGAQFVDPAVTRPGRDPKQPLDEAYTKKIKEYTTEPFFL